MSYRFDPDFSEPVSKCRRQLFFTIVSTRIHSSNDRESRSRLHRLPTFSSLDTNYSTLQDLIQSFEHAILGSIDLIDEKNASLQHGIDDNTIDELKFEVAGGVS